MSTVKHSNKGVKNNKQVTKKKTTNKGGYQKISRRKNIKQKRGKKT